MNWTYLLIALGVLEAVFLAFGLFYLPAIAKAMRLRPYWRQPETWTLWLEAIPIFNLFWQFRNVRVAKKPFAKEEFLPFDLGHTDFESEDGDFDEDEDLEDEDFDEDEDLEDEDGLDEAEQPASAGAGPAGRPEVYAKPDTSISDQTLPHTYLWMAAWGRLASVALLVPCVWVFPRFWAHDGSVHNPWAIPLAFFSMALFFTLWQRARYSRQVGRLAKGLSAENVDLATVESRDPACCSCTVKINTDPQRVTEAVLAWAKDLRWHRVEVAECPLTFRLNGRLINLLDRGHKGITIEVHVPPEGWNISVRFVAYWDSWGSFTAWYIPQLCRALMAFTRGVCSDFALRGVTVDPHELGRAVQRRDRLRKLTKVRRVSEVVFWALGLLCIPGTVLVGMWREDHALAPFGGIWLCAGFLFIADYVRRRTAGLRAVVSLLAAIFFVLMGVLLVLIGIFPPTE